MKQLKIATSPQDDDFWEKVKLLNSIHPLAVPEHMRATIQVRSGSNGSQASLVALKRVVFGTGVSKLFQSIKRRPRYSTDKGLELIECDGHRLSIEAIQRIEIELLEYNPFNPRWNGECVHNAGHNILLAMYDELGNFVRWQCACGYRYEYKEETRSGGDECSRMTIRQ